MERSLLPLLVAFVAFGASACSRPEDEGARAPTTENYVITLEPVSLDGSRATNQATIVRAESGSGSLGVVLASEVRDQANELRECVRAESERRGGGEVEGRATLRAVVTRTGGVASIGHDETTLTAPDAVRCMERVIADTHFRPFDGKPVMLVIPLELGSR